MKVIPDTRRAH